MPRNYTRKTTWGQTPLAEMESRPLLWQPDDALRKDGRGEEMRKKVAAPKIECVRKMTHSAPLQKIKKVGALARSLGATSDWRGGYGGAREKRWELTEHRHEERGREREETDGQHRRKEGRKDGRTDGRKGGEEEREKSDRGEEESEEGARLEHRRTLRSEPWAGWDPPCLPGDAATAASEAEAADLSLSLSASFSKAEDEELTSLSWLHESTDLLNSFSHSGLRSVSPLQDPDGQHPRSPSSSPSPDDGLLGDAHSAYDLAAGANRKPPYSFSCLIFMAIEDAPNKRLPVKDIYGWILEHFPYFANAPTGWKNSVRHNLSLNKCFKKVDKDRSQSIGKGSLWSIDPEYRHNLIQALKKTPYHPYSPGLATPLHLSTHPASDISPQGERGREHAW
ncbi:unnamed protein product [Pleuronectes platessa]|uniref:Forkhead box protein N3 n=1 Tax=Pleuronectes platessa TaxID=8262 RepID=A0A9N7TVN0_PLEPL|nr:unnamed protein product [Pleuronectes platessa]